MTRFLPIETQKCKNERNESAMTKALLSVGAASNLFTVTMIPRGFACGSVEVPPQGCVLILCTTEEERDHCIAKKYRFRMVDETGMRLVSDLWNEATKAGFEQLIAELRGENGEVLH